MTNPGYQVLLYYKYVGIGDPEAVRQEQRMLCEELGLKGRIIVASEGINGTVEGKLVDTEKYMEIMGKSELFQDITFKKSVGTGESFPRLSVKVRPEVVSAYMSGLSPLKSTGKYLSADELHKWYEEDREFYVVDMRNDYEYASGYFDNFIPSGMHNFFELRETLPRLQHLRDKTIVTVCTGGIRCEKASGFLVESGFKDVYQLKDGIVTYMEKYTNEHFKGKLYVFDKRITLAFNVSDPKHQVVGRCYLCGVSCDSYVNCEYNECHLHYISCESCRDLETGLPFDTKECKEKYLMKREGREGGERGEKGDENIQIIQ